MKRKSNGKYFNIYFNEWKRLPEKYNQRHLQEGEKICKTCMNNFKENVGVKSKLLEKYISVFGSPEQWIHTTAYLNCETCREKSRDRTKRRSLNIEAQEKYLLNFQQIQEEIINGRFGKRKKTKLDILWKRNASLYVNKLKLDYVISPIEKMRIYKQYRDSQDKRFYNSTKWISLRNLILNIYGKKCMKCNCIPEFEKEIHCDHILPKSLFPKEELNPFNIQVLCVSCNSSKSNIKITDYRKEEHHSLLKTSLSEELLEKYEEIDLKAKPH